MAITVCVIIIVAVIIYFFNRSSGGQDDYNASNNIEEYKPLNQNNKQVLQQLTYSPIVGNINNSYAFANRLKNIIFSREIDESQLINEVGITAEDLKKYKFSKGLPPKYILNEFENYFDVSFKYLSDYNGDKLTVFKDGIKLYTKSFNYPHKARFDKNGYCIVLDKVQGSNSELLYHLNTDGEIIGTINNFPVGNIAFVKIADNGMYALLVSEKQKVFFIDLQNHILLWDKFVRFNRYNIKDITDTELIFRFQNCTPSIDFSLDYDGQALNIAELAKYFSENAPNVRYHSDGYLFLIDALMNDFAQNEAIIILLINRMTTSNGIKYFATTKIATICKNIGKGYFDVGNYSASYDYFRKAIIYNPKIGVKTYMNKLDKLIK